MNEHLRLLVCGLVLLFSFTVAVDESTPHPFLSMSVEEAFKDNGIVTDVVDAAPKSWLQVEYKSGVSVQGGNELTPTTVKDEPTLSWDADEAAQYTVIMTDPDAPNRAEPKYREVRHWLVVNVPGKRIAEGKTLFEFIGSGPPNGSGLHRYVFLVYKQPGLLDTDEEITSKRSRKNRLSSSTRKFVEKYNLGSPVAGNFYVAQFDEYVPTLHAQFTEDPPMKL